jgi:uracil phosphoribosyltransferase
MAAALRARTHQVTAAESLLTLISELKQAVLLHDFETRNAEVTTRAQQYRDRQDKTKKARLSACVLLRSALPYLPFSLCVVCPCRVLRPCVLVSDWPRCQVLQTLHREVQDALLELSEEYVGR